MTTAVGGSLLHAAAEERRADVLEMALASLGAISLDLNQLDGAGRTPLHVAVMTSDANIVAPLLRMRANMELIADDCSTPLRLAVMQVRRLGALACGCAVPPPNPLAVVPSRAHDPGSPPVVGCGPASAALTPRR